MDDREATDAANLAYRRTMSMLAGDQHDAVRGRVADAVGHAVYNRRVGVIGLWQSSRFAALWLHDGRWLVSGRVEYKHGGWVASATLQSSVSDHAITGGTRRRSWHTRERAARHVVAMMRQMAANMQKVAA